MADAKFPEWVKTGDDESLYGKAEALGASLLVLKSGESTRAFVTTKQQTHIGTRWSIEPPTGEAVLRELEIYDKIAVQVSKSPEMNHIRTQFAGVLSDREKILAFKKVPGEEREEGIMPFVVFEGSTLMGKTQTFWSSQIDSDVPYLYLPVNLGSVQDIHACFRGQTDALLLALRRDVRERPPRDPKFPSDLYEVPTLRSLASHQFHTLGVLRQLLLTVKANKEASSSWLNTQAQIKGSFPPETCSIKDFATLGAVVVGFDEIQVLEVAEQQLLRNLIRAVKGLAVMMGTSSTICNVTSGHVASRGNQDETFPWCCLLSKFPPISWETLILRVPKATALGEPAREFLEHLMSDEHRPFGNRPGFVVKFAHALLTADQSSSFEVQLRYTATRLRTDLDHLYLRKNDPEWLHNQRCLISAAHTTAEGHTEAVAAEGKAEGKPEEEGSAELEAEIEAKVAGGKKQGTKRKRMRNPMLKFSSENSSLIRHHFANLERGPGDGTWKLYNLRAKLFLDLEGEEPFTPSIVFPAADDECLLHLIFSNQPFNPLTTRQVFHGKQYSDNAPNNNSPEAKSNDGQALESCFAAATMCASQHRDANFGLTAEDFVTNLVMELLLTKKKTVNVSKSARDILSALKWDVPYFPPANMHFCSIYEKLLHLGHLKRTPNSEKIDYRALLLKGKLLFSGESKDWERSIKVDEIMARIPVGSPLHLVICNVCPHSTGVDAPNTKVRLVSVKNDEIQLSAIKGIDDPVDVATLMLVFELTSME